MTKYLRIFCITICILVSTGINLFAESDSTTRVNTNHLSLNNLKFSYPNIIPANSDSANLANRRHLNFSLSENNPDPFHTEINYSILAGMGAVYLGAATYLHIHQANAWWADDRTKFHITNDWHYALAIDKIGHFYGTNIMAHAFSGAFDASNVQAEKSAIYSALAAFSYEMLIEYEDGFGKNWGFSPGDFSADLVGALFYMGQYYYPFLKNFQPRFSYIPTKEFKEDPNRIIIDDYEGQKYWISMRVKNFLPDKAAQYWPSFLNLSAGMGVRDLDGSGGGQREFYLALDIDAEELIPLEGPFWQFVKNSINYFHFPMPGIRITPDAAFLAIVF